MDSKLHKLFKDLKFVLLVFYCSVFCFFAIILEIVTNLLRGTRFGPRWYTGDVRVDGKVAIVTGGNSGIGKETATELARRGAKVILACRNEKKALDAIEDIKSQVPAANVVFQSLDLAALKSVRQFVDNLKESKIDLLINNAGVLGVKEKTEDGFEMHLGTNHLGHFLLTLLLLSKLKKSAHARVVNVSSLLYSVGYLNFKDINLNNGYFQRSHAAAYCRSKLANILFTRELSKRFQGTNITTYAAHPGYVRTEIFRHINESGNWLAKITSPDGVGNSIKKWISRNPQLGAQTILFCALNSAQESKSGLYYENCKPVKCMAPNARHEKSAKRLWTLSCKLVGIDENCNLPNYLLDSSNVALQKLKDL